ncbi:MFS transporter [Paenibacillus sp. JX-17]|uniref:MFS transporter n=1 Tax=Paenibacillus lacisoli TaxID=3064525 RepID=A0ABT9C9I8_9BACL|nr:MFS transporter [Paenibacillus sp. JX-17]MDO7905929.1 MFS transporter [Paenibacillus sp. JX-17]
MQDNNQKLWTQPFIILTLCNLLLFLQLQMILSSIPVYAKSEFHANALEVSLITSLFALSAIAARLFSGRMLEKGHRSVLIFVGLLLALCGTLGYQWAAGIVTLILMRMVFGIGFGMSSTAFPTMASDVLPLKRIGEGMGYFGLSTSLAMSIGPTIGLTMLKSYGFSSLVYSTAAVIIVIVPLAFYLIRRLPKNHIEPPAVEPAEGKKPAFNRKLILPAALNGLMSLTYGGLLGFIALFGEEAHLSNPAFFFLFNAAAVLIVRPISGRIYDRSGHKMLLIPGSILMIVSLVMLSFAHTNWWLYTTAFIYGLGFGVMQPSLQAWMIQVVSPKQRGMANGMFLNSLDFGVAIGALVLGAVAKATSYMAMYRYSAIAIVLFLVIYLIQMRTSSANKTSVKPS